MNLMQQIVVKVVLDQPAQSEMDKFEHILSILNTMLRYSDKESEYNKGVQDTLKECIKIVEAHKDAGTRSIPLETGSPQA